LLATPTIVDRRLILTLRLPCLSLIDPFQRRQNLAVHGPHANMRGRLGRIELFGGNVLIVPDRNSNDKEIFQLRN
jgi:hypothetical protein